MNNDLVSGVIWTVVVAVIGIVLLSLGAQGALPNGFGLFDMSNFGTRAAVFVVLVVIVAVLGAIYFKGQGSAENVEIAEDNG